MLLWRATAALLRDTMNFRALSMGTPVMLRRDLPLYVGADRVGPIRFAKGGHGVWE